jgi:glycosyltransferase involved in cell wall biosynthesis
LVGLGDVEDLQNKIEILINNPVECRKMGEAARKEAEEKYSFKKIDNNLIGLLNIN